MSEQLALFGVLESDLSAELDDRWGDESDGPSGKCCLDCGRDTISFGEYYTVHDEVWLRANPTDDGMLCIGCVEQRLGRRLTPADFTDAPINVWAGMHGWRASSRLVERLRGAAA